MRFKVLPFCVLALGGVALAGCGGGGKEALSGEKLDAKIKPSVVQITGKQGSEQIGGSGFLIDAKNGYVVTNAHVVAGVQAIKAKVGDSSTQTAARVVGTAPCDDLAVLQLADKPTNAKPLKFGDSAKVKSGQQITVYGFPTSAQANTPTGESTGQATQVVSNTGTVSAANIQAAPGGDLPRLSQVIQHQAPTNQGNSGGPVVNKFGDVVGVTSIGFSPGAAQNINYAIAAAKVKSILPVLESGKSQGDVGWDLIPLDNVIDSLPQIFSNDPDLSSQSLGQAARTVLKRNNVRGLYVKDSTTGSPARNVHIAFGDLITKIEGTDVKNVQDVCDIVQSHSPGDKLRIRGYLLNSATKRDDVLKSWTETLTLK